jgi:transcriptional regulator with XRE-family HTH domain
MQNIGYRAVKAIKERSRQNGTTLSAELQKLSATRQNYNRWEEKGGNPNAFFLQQMAFAGYDVMWILTGKENRSEN